MKLILHIGTEKTGTTSVQRWLANNHEQLVKDGVFYSKALGRPDNRKLSVFAIEFDQPDDGFNLYDILSVQEHKSFCLDVKRILKAEIAQAEKLGINVFVISSEHLHSRLITLEATRKLKQLLLPLFDDVEVLCYLRPQAALMQSRISVGLRQLSGGVHELKTYLTHESYYNYFDLWSRWNTFFPKVTVRPFNRCKDVVADLCALVGVDLSQYPERTRFNQKLDYRAGVLSYNMGRFLSNTSIERSFLPIFFESLPVSEPVRISRSLAAAINEKYHSSNVSLVKAVPSLDLEDLEADISKFPEEGNAEKMFTQWTANDFFGLVLARTNFELYLERVLRKITESERASARRNPENARRFLGEANELLRKVEENVIEEEEIFLPVIQKIETIKIRIKNVASRMTSAGK